MPIVNRLPINANIDDEHYEVLVSRQTIGNSDTQQSNMQEHIVNQILANSVQKENLRHKLVHRNRDKQDEKNSTCTSYGRTVKKPDRLTYNQYITFHIPTVIAYMDMYYR